jgi:hypothetical protein
VLVEKMLKFKLLSAYTVHFPAGEEQGLLCSVLLGRAAIFGHEQHYGFEDSPRAGHPRGEGRDGGE